MDRFMKRAIDLAVENVQNGGQPYGAVIVKDGEIVAEGKNTLHDIYDISGHAELQAMRDLQKKIKRHDLSGFTMYASGEPCIMCQSAMYLAGIDQIFYCQTMDDAIEAGFPEEDCLTIEKVERLGSAMKHIQLTAEVENPIKRWAYATKK